MTFGLKITDRYLCREFLTTLAGVIAACAVILLIARVFEEFDNILGSGASGWMATKYILFSMPYRILEVVPLATMLAVIFSIGTLARNREMLAITAGGQSPYRSAAPVLLTALGITFGMLILNETLVPYCEEQANYYNEVHIKGESELSMQRRRDIFEKGMGNIFYTMSEYDAQRNRMWDVWIFEERPDSMDWLWCVKAKSAQLVSRNVEPQKDAWRFDQAIEYRYDEEGRPSSMTVYTEPVTRHLESGLEAYLGRRKEPEQMNVRELKQYIRTLQVRGEDVAGYVTDWYSKLAFPFSTVILTTISFALALRAHLASLPLSFGLGILLTVMFYALTALGQTMGRIGAVSPVVGALGPLIAYGLMGAYLMRRSGC